ncbi:MAG: hypothetical protein C4525_15850 [Desulfarculus sp.]|jgi:hypothetical protein|nr:MAG: hypothetical protein C4525_15850 [Desulfarculus sp.]
MSSPSRPQYLVLVLLAALIMLLSTAAVAQAGSLIKAACPCGFHTEVMAIFGGFVNFKTYCGFPVYCPDCATLAVANLYAEEVSCAGCPGSAAVPYDHPSLIGRPGDKVVASWNTAARLGRALKLTDGEYLCPVCKKFTLRFTHVGFWD